MKDKLGVGYIIVLVFGWLILLGGIAGLAYAVAINHFI